MERDKCVEACIEIYSAFNTELLGGEHFEMQYTSNAKVVLEKYLDFVDKNYSLEHIGVRFFIHYIECAFNYYYKDSKSMGSKKRIYFHWIFGKKAIDKYEKYWKNDKRKAKEISFVSGISIIRKWEDDGFRKLFREQCIGINKAEETSKGMYFNDIKGYVYCSANTSLYNHLSENCVLCNYIKNCKENLKKNFPLLYKLRGYGK